MESGRGEWWRWPTSSPVPGFPTCFAAYSRFSGRNGRHRAGGGRELWNPVEESGGAGRRHRLFQVFQHASSPIPGFPAEMGVIGQEEDGNRGIRWGQSGGAPLRHWGAALRNAGSDPLNMSRECTKNPRRR